MSLSTNKIILAGSGAVTNSAGAYYQQAVVTASNTSGTGVVVPAGVWQVLPTANVVIQFNTSNNSAALSWTTILAASTAGLFISDGVNVQAVTNDTTTHSVVFYGSNGGNAVSGTFNV